jgi:ATP-binding cassette subfamily B protein
MINGRLITLLSDAKKYVYYEVFSQWFILILRILMTFLVSYLIDSYINSSLTKAKIILSINFTFFSLIAYYYLNKLYVRSATKASLDVKRILRKKIYSKLIKLGIIYNKDFAASNLVQLTVEGVEQLETFFGQYYPQLIYSLFSTITSFMAVSIISFTAGISLFLCIPLIPISIVIVQKIAIKILGKYWKSYTDLGETFLENLQGLTTLKIYQYDEQKSLEMDEQAEKFRKETMKLLVMQLNSISIMDIMSLGGGAVGMLVALYKYKNGIISFGGTFAIIMFSADFFSPLRRLGSFFHVAMNGVTASKNIFKFLD